MRESVKYYDEHNADIKMIREWFTDEKSKRVWTRMIKFRKTRNYKLFPGKELPQYFIDSIIHFGKHEVFIDCGGYDGATSLEFISNVEAFGGMTR